MHISNCFVHPFEAVVATLLGSIMISQGRDVGVTSLLLWKSKMFRPAITFSPSHPAYNGRLLLFPSKPHIPAMLQSSVKRTNLTLK
jgi:hypothetical protein